MNTKSQSPGDIIDAYCTSCRTVMNHTIVAMVETRVARVQCNTCGGTHNYRPAPGSRTAVKAAPRTAATSRPARKEPGAAERDEWLKLQQAARNGKAQPYRMTATYAVNDAVDHPTFGLGVVCRKSIDNKVEILFESGRKLLRCG